MCILGFRHLVEALIEDLSKIQKGSKNRRGGGVGAEGKGKGISLPVVLDKHLHVKIYRKAEDSLGKIWIKFLRQTSGTSTSSTD